MRFKCPVTARHHAREEGLAFAVCSELAITLFSLLPLPPLLAGVEDDADDDDDDDNDDDDDHHHGDDDMLIIITTASL